MRWSYFDWRLTPPGLIRPLTGNLGMTSQEHSGLCEFDVSA